MVHKKHQSATAFRMKTKKKSDLSYSHNIDDVSEVQIADAVHLINYCIDNAICNLLYAIKESGLDIITTDHPHKNDTTPLTKPMSSNIPQSLWTFLMDSRQSQDNAFLVVDAILHNLVLSLLYKHFFEDSPENMLSKHGSGLSSF
jgi:hypothetical protein